jgi:hypothetical protein
MVRLYNSLAYAGVKVPREKAAQLHVRSLTMKEEKGTLIVKVNARAADTSLDGSDKCSDRIELCRTDCHS